MSAQTPSGNQQKTQPGANSKLGRKVLIAGIVVVLLAALVAALWFARQPEAPVPDTLKPAAEDAGRKVKNQPVIEYKKDSKNSLMEKRKAAFGVRDGLDMIVREGESIKVGDQTVSVKEIRDSIHAREGGITERDLASPAGDSAGAYGIHIVQPGDNIWNIHYRLLRAYLAGKDIVLPDKSDEPDRSGYSSGIGKLLKFSENMVYIYNIRERQLVADIHLIRPLTKIVIYKMDRVFDLLDQLDDHNASRIRFDGENIWIPAD